MGITPKDPANFDPTMGNYTDLRPFRFWCQKVLPLVYDDSLSYYEVLCKLVDYLNKTMEDVGVLHEDVDALHTAYQQLQSYVNDYFSTLDVQQEINNKLDEMAADGTLDALILPYFNAYKAEIDGIVSTQNQTLDLQNERIEVLKERMDAFASLPDGSTAGDAELTDIRIGANGKTYASAGDAVRAQITNCENIVINENNYVDHKYFTKTAVSFTETDGYFISRLNGDIEESENYSYTSLIDIYTLSRYFFVSAKCDYQVSMISAYDSESTWLGSFIDNGSGQSTAVIYGLTQVDLFDIITKYPTVRYIRISTKIADVTAQLYIESGLDDNKVINRLRIENNIFNNILSYATVSGGFYNSEGVWQQSAQNKCYMTGRIQTQPGETFLYTGRYGYTAVGALFFNDNNVIGAAYSPDNWNTPTDEEINIPANCNNVQFFAIENINDHNVNFNVKIKNNLVNELVNIRVSYDDKTYNTAGEAVRDQVSNLHNIIDTENNYENHKYYGKSNVDLVITDDKFINRTNGLIEDATGYCISNLIPISNLTRFINLSASCVYNVSMISVYDDSENWIDSYIDNGDGGGTTITYKLQKLDIFDIIDKYPDTAYIRLSSKISNAPLQLVIESGSELYNAVNRLRIENNTLNKLTSIYVITGGYYKPDGTWDINADLKNYATPKIQVEPGDKFIYKGRYGYNAAAAIYFNNDAVISAEASPSNWDTDEHEFTIPANCNTVQFFSTCNVANNINMKLEIVSGLTVLNNSIKVTTHTLGSGTTIDTSTYSMDYFLNFYDGDIVANSGSCVSDYIFITDLLAIYAETCAQYSTCGMALYDKDKNFIAALRYRADEPTGQVYNINGYDYIFDILERYPDAVWCRYGTLNYTKHPLVIKTYKQTNKILPYSYGLGNTLFGKKYVSCGDSFTHGDTTGLTDSHGNTGVNSAEFYDSEWNVYKTYAWHIARRNCMDFVNLGVNGGVMALLKSYVDGQTADPDQNHPFSNLIYKNIPADTDYLTIWYGINDSYATYLGTIDDDTNETFYGAWNVVLPYLIEHHPYMKIGIIITNFGAPQYRQAVREVATKWGIPYLDLMGDKQIPMMAGGRESSVGVASDAVDLRNAAFKISASNIHPTEKAHEYESTFIEHFIRSL